MPDGAVNERTPVAPLQWAAALEGDLLWVGFLLPGHPPTVIHNPLGSASPEPDFDALLEPLELMAELAGVLCQPWASARVVIVLPEIVYLLFLVSGAPWLILGLRSTIGMEELRSITDYCFHKASKPVAPTEGTH